MRGIGVTVAALLTATMSRGASGADGLYIEPLGCGGGSSYGLTCQIGNFGGAQYREKDPRVDAIQRGGHAGGAVRLIAPTDTQSTIVDVVSRLAPGDHLVLQNGTWSNLQLTVVKNGTAAAPITIRPQSPGGVVLSGNTQLDLRGAHLIVADLKIRDATFASNTTVVGLGNSSGACNYCIAIDLHMQNLNAAPGHKINYLGVRGKDVSVAYSTFRDFNSLGHFVYTSAPTEDGVPARLHLFRNLFYNRSFNPDVNVYLLQSPEGDSVYTGSSSSGVFLWGAQLERDVTATVLRSN